MAAGNQGYRKKQAPLVLLVFVCVAVAIFSGSAPVSVGAILAACGLIFWASTLEPKKSHNQGHH